MSGKLSENCAKHLPMVCRTFANAGFLPEFGCALAHQESAWDPDAMVITGADGHRGGAFGLFQVTMKTARALGFKGTEQGLLYPDVNAEWAVRLALDNKRVLGAKADYQGLAAAHNCGAGRVRNGTIPKVTAEQYVPRIVTLMDLYRDRAAQYRVK